MPGDETKNKTQYGTGVQSVVVPTQTPQPGVRPAHTPQPAANPAYTPQAAANPAYTPQAAANPAYTPQPAASPVQTPLPANIPAAGLAPAPTAPPDPLVGQTVAGRYYVEKKLGEGGMGAVYAAMHVTLEKRVALKVLHGEFTRKADLVERFLLEAKAASRIRHENVIDISDFGQTPDGAVFFAMEYLQGKDLHDLIARAKAKGEALPWARTREIFLQICAALKAAHGKSIVHRDLKPENIYLITWAGHEDFVKLLDFGIAKVTDVGDSEEGRKLTKTGMLFGTPEYMSPEQARGDKADHRVDVYAMGCILYQLMTGDVPFRADNFMGILSMHLTEMPAEITQEQLARVGAPPALASVAMKALAKAKEARFQSIEEMADAVRAADQGQSVATPQAVPGRSKTNWTGSAQISSQVPTPGSPPRPETAATRSGGKPIGLMIGGLVLAAAVGVGAFVLLAGGSGGNETTAEAPIEPLAALPAAVKVKLSSSPSVAKVIDVKDGAVLGTTPFDLDVPGSRENMRFRLELEGYRSQVLIFVPDQDVEHAVQFQALAEGPATAQPQEVVVPQERPNKIRKLPRGDKPKGDKPKTDPKGDKPKTDPKIDKPKTDKPKTDKPKTDKPKTDPKIDKPKTDPKIDKPKGDKPDDSDEPVIKNPFENK